MRACIALAVPFLAAAATSPFAGDRICAECHREQTSHYRETPMARALEPVSMCDTLKQNSELTFQEGAYLSRITREGDRSFLTVIGGGETIRRELLWAFGRGRAGQTYVFQNDGVYYESRVSFYREPGGLDLTMGARGSTPSGIEEAAGRRMDANDMRDCFGCHSTGAVSQNKLHLEALSPGVGCESCHGPAEKHVAAVRAGDVAGAAMPHLGKLTADEMSERCGRCHRTWSQIAAHGPHGVYNVRFQPYRLANSKCYDTGDARIRCTACHDPHGAVDSRASSYDVKCRACHTAAPSASAKICRVAKANCVSCHMPKIDLPGAHARFTDHQIRIVRAGEPYPN